MGAVQENISLGVGIGNLLTNLMGKDSTTVQSDGTKTSTVTKQTQISDAALKSLIQSMLEDQSTGLAKVASGARSSGLYNSSSQQLLVNDLISRASNAAALASAPTTTTETTTSTPTTKVTSQAGMLDSSNLSTLAPLLGVGLLMKKGDNGKSGFDTLSESLGGFFGGDSGAASVAPIATATSFGGGADTLSSVLSDNAESFFSNLVDNTANVAVEAAPAIVDTISSAVSGGSSSIWDDITETVSSWFSW